MKVFCHYRNDPERPLVDPVPELDNPLTVQAMDGRRFICRLMSGDVCTPLLGTFFGEKWFEPPFPRWVIRFHCTLWMAIAITAFATALLGANIAAAVLHSVWWSVAIPVTLLFWFVAPGKFLAWRWPFSRRAFYAGAKVFGVDSPAYKEWTSGIKPEDVYEGSQALCCTIRPSASIPS